MIIRIKDPLRRGCCVTLRKVIQRIRMRHAIDKILRMTDDESFVTSRQTIQSLWKVAATGKAMQKRVVDHLAKQYGECIKGRHYNLIRQDIIQCLRDLYHTAKDQGIEHTAFELIGMEKESWYRKKYEALWGTHGHRGIGTRPTSR